jgi:F-type H+-transporting ATPase subunit b
MALFLVLMAVLNKLLFKPTLAAVTLREQRTTGARQEADRVREEAEGKVTEFDKRLREARAEASAGRKKLRDEGAERRQELTDAARSEAAELLDSSRVDLGSAATEARKGVTAAADSLAGQIVARLIGNAAVICMIVGFANDAWASGAPKTVGDFLTGAMFAAINLAILLFLFVKMGKAGTSEFLQNRQDEVTRDLAEAKRLREEAQGMLDDYGGKLDGLDDERDRLIEQFTAEGETAKERLISEGKAQAERLLEDAKRTIDRDVRRVQLELQGEVLDRALSQATERLRSEVGAVEQKGLVDDFLGRVRDLDASSGVN